MADNRILLISNISVIKAVWTILRKVLLTISTFLQIEQTKNVTAISIERLGPVVENPLA